MLTPLFEQSSQLPLDLQPLQSKIHATERKLVEGLPATRTYTQLSFDSLCAAASSEPDAVAAALQQLGIVQRQTFTVCECCGLCPDACFEDTPRGVIEITKYNIIGRLMALISSIQASNAAPVFLSIRVAEGATAGQEILNNLPGIAGFICTRDLQSGDEWRKEIEQPLRQAGMLVSVETPSYHESVFCRTEFAFAVLRGIPVMRILLANQADLRGCPTWADRVYHESFGNGSGGLDVVKLLGKTVPGPLSPSVQKHGARYLIEQLSSGEVERLASQLGIRAHIPNGTQQEKQNALLDEAFRKPLVASQIASYLDLEAILG